MFGVFIRRWNSTRKRVSNNDRNESPGTDGSISPEPPDRPPGKVRQVHPEEKTQVLAYDSSFRKKNKPKTLPIEDNNQMYNHLANTNVAMSPMYPLTPNICVEGGKIEFIKSPSESARNSVALASPTQTPLVIRRNSRPRYDEPTEKFDGGKDIMNWISLLIYKMEEHSHTVFLGVVIMFTLYLLLDRRAKAGGRDQVFNFLSGSVQIDEPTPETAK